MERPSNALQQSKNGASLQKSKLARGRAVADGAATALPEWPTLSIPSIITTAQKETSGIAIHTEADAPRDLRYQYDEVELEVDSKIDRMMEESSVIAEFTGEHLSNIGETPTKSGRVRNHSGRTVTRIFRGIEVK